MTTLYLHNGGILTVNGALAADPSCCCTSPCCQDIDDHTGVITLKIYESTFSSSGSYTLYGPVSLTWSDLVLAWVGTITYAGSPAGVPLTEPQKHDFELYCTNPLGGPGGLRLHEKVYDLSGNLIGEATYPNDAPQCHPLYAKWSSIIYRYIEATK